MLYFVQHLFIVSTLGAMTIVLSILENILTISVNTIIVLIYFLSSKTTIYS
ncbi:Uncharacterised protein [Bacteroides intestinalis]|uniref:Uncharacterized protein n=1 Tax=Bacteroides intestinalis TaxID=329854 RepID=A0A6N2W9I8_9BACE